VTAYYNEIDPYAAQWLRNLINAGHIASGVVDERSIEDVHPSDLEGFVQCHFFAGVGVWSYALRRAGWPDSRPVWTGSCPCQPFSASGKGDGFADERHLWPAFFHLIEKRRPAKVIGEQVASKDADAWIDLVQDDLEALDYAVGAVPFPAASVGAPHIRDRLYWVADSDRAGLAKRERVRRVQPGALGAHPRQAAIGIGHVGRLAYADGRNPGAERKQRSGQHGQQPQDGGPSGWLADACGQRRAGQSVRLCERGQESSVSEAAGAGPVGGFWGNAEWIWCRDEKLRPVEPGTFPLASGVAGRVGQLRAYGNAINAEQARIFIESVMEAA
jgi:DNA (cytosine-5)-methyltransferase 1